ncbi:MAG: hypothetical protein HY301_21565, partial [Verrucomicrobia bacterium]|nr:hypothetical protein [Verrucomicrobiota bacterium]
MRFPLYAKILLWFFLNLVLLAAGVWLFGRAQFQLGLDSLIAGRAGERVQAVADVLTAELRDAKREDWDDVLDRFSEAYRLHFYLFRADGAQAAGTHVSLPGEVGEKVRDVRGLVGGRRPGENFPNAGNPPTDPRRGGNFRPDGTRLDPGQPEGSRPDANLRKDGAPRPEPRPPGEPQPNGARPQNRRPGAPQTPGGAGEGEGFRPGGPPADETARAEQRAADAARGLPGPRFGDGPRPFGPAPGPSPKFMVHAGEPKLYWVGVRLPLADRDGARALPLTLLAASESFAGGGLFVDFTPWIVLGAGALV